MSDVNVVLGATGGLGGAVTATLAAAGRAVRAVSRSGARSEVWQEHQDIEVVAADAATADGIRGVVRDAHVVYHCAQPAYHRWAAEFPDMTRTIADACAAAGARLVLADNLYMYGPLRGPISEDTPQQPRSHKGQVRRAMADELLARHLAGDLEVTIGRASDYYGPGGRDSTPGVLVFGALAKGKRPRWMGALDQPHTLHYLPDAGRALVALGDAPNAGGRAWILPADRPRTGAEWLRLAQRAAGRDGAPAVITPWQNRLAGLFVRQVRELNEIMDQFTEPFVVDDRAFRGRFDGEGWVTPAEEGVPATVQWFQV